MTRKSTKATPPGVPNVQVDFTAAEETARDAEETKLLEARAKVAYIAARKEAYGTLEEQIEYLVENGITALKSRNNAIKAANPKSGS